MQADLIAIARRIGVAMGSRQNGAQIGWTTDDVKASACNQAGLIVLGVNTQGWEIIAPADPEAAGNGEAVEAARERGQ